MTKRRELFTLSVLVAWGVAACGGCGADPDTTISTHPAPANTSDPYLTILTELRDAAAASATYDAYGFALDLPDPQRAAIDAFCLLADRAHTAQAAETLADPAHFSARVAAVARSEAEGAPKVTVRQAVGRLEKVIDSSALDLSLARSYAKACYG